VACAFALAVCLRPVPHGKGIADDGRDDEYHEAGAVGR
jgi:hypothetical protein